MIKAIESNDAKYKTINQNQALGFLFILVMNDLIHFSSENMIRVKRINQ